MKRPRDHGNRARNLSHMNTPARLPGRHFFDKIASLLHHSDQNRIIFAVYVFSKACELALFSQ